MKETFVSVLNIAWNDEGSNFLEDMRSHEILIHMFIQISTF